MQGDRNILAPLVEVDKSIHYESLSLCTYCYQEQCCCILNNFKPIYWQIIYTCKHCRVYSYDGLTMAKLPNLWGWIKSTLLFLSIEWKVTFWEGVNRHLVGGFFGGGGCIFGGWGGGVFVCILFTYTLLFSFCWLFIFYLIFFIFRKWWLFVCFFLFLFRLRSFLDYVHYMISQILKRISSS